MIDESLRQFIIRRKGEMEQERSSYVEHWKELAEFVLPRAPRFTTDGNSGRGQKANKKIVDGTATIALRSLVSGLMAGVTTPSRPWFRLQGTFGKTPKDLAVWLHDVTRTMQEVLVQSNFYTESAKLYQSLALFGTGAMAILPDDENIVRCETFSIGSYYLGTNERRVVDEFLREFSLSVRQMVEMFDYENLSPSTQQMADNKRWDTRITVYHYIGPNKAYNSKSKFNKDKRYKECYIEVGGSTRSGSQLPMYIASADDNKVLLERGYDTFPIVAPRWEADGEDVYGTQCPGMQALPDIKRLQAEQKVKAKAIEKQADPPTIASPALAQKGVNSNPGATTFGDMRAGFEPVRPMYQVQFDVSGVMADIQEIQRRISRFFFEELFTAMLNERRSGTKAREVEEIHDEKMTLIGPTYDRLNDEFLDPTVNRVFDIVNARGMFPPAPKQYQGTAKWKPEYISPMAQAQKMVGIAAQDRVRNVVGIAAGFKPEVLDLYDIDEDIRTYAEITGLPPRIIRSPEEVDAIRKARAQEQQAVQAMQSAQALADTAQTLSQVNTKEDNGLTQLTNAIAPL